MLLKDSLKTKTSHDANFVIIGGTAARPDNLHCHQWWESWRNDNSRFQSSPYIQKTLADDDLAMQRLRNYVGPSAFTDVD